MARTVKQDGHAVVQLRTEGAVIIPKPLRERLGLRPGDVLEIDVQDGDLILRPRLLRKLVLSGVPAAAIDALVGTVSLGGDAVRDKARIYDR